MRYNSGICKDGGQLWGFADVRKLKPQYQKFSQSGHWKSLYLILQLANQYSYEKGYVKNTTNKWLLYGIRVSQKWKKNVFKSFF
jgi:hypothetical protein